VRDSPAVLPSRPHWADRNSERSLAVRDSRAVISGVRPDVDTRGIQGFPPSLSLTASQLISDFMELQIWRWKSGMSIFPYINLSLYFFKLPYHTGRRPEMCLLERGPCKSGGHFSGKRSGFSWVDGDKWQSCACNRPEDCQIRTKQAKHDSSTFLQGVRSPQSS